MAPDVRPRGKRQSDCDPYAPDVIRRWQEGERNATHMWGEIVAQGDPGSQRMVERFLKTLKTHEVGASASQRLPHDSSTAAVSLFMRRPDTLEELQREHLAAFRQADPSLDTTYQLAQDFLLMMRKREGERLDRWLAQVHQSQLPELESFAEGVERDKAAVQAGLTLVMKNGQVEGQVTRMKLIKRMMYGKAGFALLRQRVLNRISRRRRIGDRASRASSQKRVPLRFSFLFALAFQLFTVELITKADTAGEPSQGD